MTLSLQECRATNGRPRISPTVDLLPSQSPTTVVVSERPAATVAFKAEITSGSCLSTVGYRCQLDSFVGVPRSE